MVVLLYHCTLQFDRRPLRAIYYTTPKISYEILGGV
nr:MAG TPA: hypothetical protein [Caudoviricetes sp.]